MQFYGFNSLTICHPIIIICSAKIILIVLQLLARQLVKSNQNTILNVLLETQNNTHDVAVTTISNNWIF